MNTTITINELVVIIGIAINVFIFIGGLFSVWVGVKVRLAKLETSQKLEIENIRCDVSTRFKAMDSKIAGQEEFFGQRLTEFTVGNKDDHHEIKAIVEKIFEKIDYIKDNFIRKD